MERWEGEGKEEAEGPGERVGERREFRFDAGFHSSFLFLFSEKKNSARNDANDFGKPEAAQGRRAARGARPARPGLDGAQGGPAGAARGGARCRRQRRRCSGAQYRCCCRCRCCGCCRSYCPRHRRPDLPASRAHVGPCRCGKGENGQSEGSSRKRSHEKLAFDVDAYFFPHFFLPLLSLLNSKERKKTLTSPPPPRLQLSPAHALSHSPPRRRPQQQQLLLLLPPPPLVSRAQQLLQLLPMPFRLRTRPPSLPAPRPSSSAGGPARRASASRSSRKRSSSLPPLS